MAEGIRVSVIIPFFNDELYLEDSVRSAISQNESKIEILCINDGSTDSSKKILRKCAQRDRRIRMIEQENQGLSGARNTGIREAKGEFLCFLDADDRLKPEAIQTLYRQATENQADIVSFDGCCFFQTPELYDKKRGQYYVRKKSYGLMEGTQMFTEMREKGDYCDSACLLFIRTDWLRKSGILFYPKIYHEDCLFTLQCMFHSKRVLHINKVLYERRIRENSITTIPKTIKHLYGKMICHICFCKLLFTQDLTERQATALADFSRTMVREMKEILAVLPQKEYEKLLKMPLTPAMRLSLEQAGIEWKKTDQHRITEEREKRKDTTHMVNVEKIVEMLREEIAQKKDAVKMPEKEHTRLLNKLEGKDSIIIVGSGNLGLQCFEILRSGGEDRICCFADNSYEKYPYGLMGKKVISLEEAAKKYRKSCFIVTPKYYFMEIIRQLNGLGIPLEQIDCWIGF